MADGLKTLVLAVGIGALLATAAVLVALAASRLLASRSASLRHALWTSALGAGLLFPLAVASPPALHVVRIPASVWPAEIASVTSPASPAFQALPARLFPPGDAHGDDASSNGAAWLWLIVAIIWAGGAACVTTRTLLARARAASIVRRATPIGSGPLPRLCRALTAGKSRRVAVLFESAEIGGAATVGLWRPVIVLPVSSRSWDEGRARAVLSHELAHVRRHDGLTQLLSRLACAAYWCNPLIWLADRRMAAERERACDDVVLEAGAIPLDYASLLLGLARSDNESPAPAGALSFVRVTELEIRLRAILDPALARGTCPPIGQAAFTAGAACVVFLCASIGAEPVQPVAAQMVPSGASALALEPDRRGDSLSTPMSELLPLVNVSYAVRRSRAAESGPDSGLVRVLYGALDRIPHGPADLVRERAAWALVQVEGDRLTEPLINQLRHDDWRVRCYAAWALAQAGDRRAVAPLLEQLDNPNWRVRAMASFALSAIGDPAARAGLFALLRDEAWQVRVNAAEFAGRFDDEAARTALRTARRDAHPAVRRAAADALAHYH